jgi:hypothetical protein
MMETDKLAPDKLVLALKKYIHYPYGTNED